MILYYLLYGILWIWQLPQNISGFLLALFFRQQHIGPAGFKFIQVKYVPGFCLGEYLFIGSTEVTRFIYGRGLLSRILGPFFLPLITLPTILVIILGNDFLFLNLYATKWSFYVNNIKNKKSRI
jgi:hypothetical protein